MGGTYQEKREREREREDTNFRGNQNISDQYWGKSRETTSDKITQLREFQTNNAEMQKQISSDNNLVCCLIVPDVCLSAFSEFV